MNNENHFTYRYKLGFRQFVNLLIGLAPLGFSIFLLIRFPVDITLIIIASILASTGLISLFLMVNYLSKSLRLEIRIDHDMELFEVNRKGKRLTFNLSDITSLEIKEQRNIGLYGFDFDYAKYTFVNGKHCIVTNMMTDNYYIPKGLEPKIALNILPIIWSGADF